MTQRYIFTRTMVDWFDTKKTFMWRWYTSRSKAMFWLTLKIEIDERQQRTIFFEINSTTIVFACYLNMINKLMKIKYHFPDVEY